MRPSLLALLLVALAAAPAHAATVGVQGTTLTLTAPNGETNSLTVALAGSTVRVTDAGAVPAAGAGCTLSVRTVSCPRAGLTDLFADLADRNDRMVINDSVPLRSRVRGGSGNDTLDSGGGPDELDGGSGNDSVSYSNRPVAVSVTLAGGADDGGPSEGDNLVSVESVVGTAGNDVLAGGGAADRIDGFRGDDRIDGAGGGDTLIGGLGADAIVGGDGDDVFASVRIADGADVYQGGAGTDRADYAARTSGNGVVAQPDGRPESGERPGAGLAFTDPLPSLALLVSEEGDLIQPDVENVRGTSFADVLGTGPSGGRLEGLAGTDVLSGGRGGDSLQGGAGFDRLLSRDGRADTITCGTQIDRVHADGSDTPNADCESVLRSFAVSLAPVARTLDAEGILPVRVSCPPQASVRCAGALRATTVRRYRTDGGRLRPLLLSAERFNIPAGTSAEVSLVIDRVLLAQTGSTVRTRLAARGRDAAGPARPAASRLVLRAG